MGSGVRRTKWLEQSESQRLETLVIVIRAYSPTTNHPFYGWFVIQFNTSVNQVIHLWKYWAALFAFPHLHQLQKYLQLHHGSLHQ